MTAVRLPIPQAFPTDAVCNGLYNTSVYWPLLTTTRSCNVNGHWWLGRYSVTRMFSLFLRIVFTLVQILLRKFLFDEKRSEMRELPSTRNA